MNGETETPIQHFGLQIYLEFCPAKDRAKGNQQNPAGEN